MSAVANMSRADRRAAMTHYKNQILQDTYTKAMSTARAGGVDLFTADGCVRRIGSMAVAFWNGYDGKPRGPMEPQGSMASAMFAAGRDFKREQSARKVEP